MSDSKFVIKIRLKGSVLNEVYLEEFHCRPGGSFMWGHTEDIGKAFQLENKPSVEALVLFLIPYLTDHIVMKAQITAETN